MNQRYLPNRRETLAAFLALVPSLHAQTQKEPDPKEPKDWTCPMDPDIHLDAPGKCPRCGMTLVLQVPDRVEYPLELTVAPNVLQPGALATLFLKVVDPTGHPARHFEIVHEKLMHLFVVSQNLEFFAHVHPIFQKDGSFQLPIRLPDSGMYRLLADYYPSGSVPQLSVETLYVHGPSHPAHLSASLAPQKTENMTASLRLETDKPIAGLLTRLYYDIDPSDGLEPYLGAWGHMLAVSEDLVDLMHMHPFIAGKSTVQFNVIFPRPGNYRIWSQFQRKSVVNTTVFTLNVKEL